jgi:hypothetical protein
MKKIILFAVTAFAVVSMSSCKKTRTCTCTDTFTDASGSTTSTYSAVITKITKKGAAQGVCASTTTTNTQTLGGVSYTSTDVVTCTIN